jgi:hypothetical protein
LLTQGTLVQVAYWGQDSSGTEKSLTSYCYDNTYDIIVVGFADVWGNGGDLQINLANQYAQPLLDVFESLAHCVRVCGVIACVRRVIVRSCVRATAAVMCSRARRC